MTAFYDTEADWSEVDSKKSWFPIWLFILALLVILYFTLNK